MSFDFPDGKVERHEGGVTIGGVPISEQQANALQQGVPVDGFPSGVSSSDDDSILLAIYGTLLGLLFLSTCSTIKSPPPRTNTPTAPATAVNLPPLVKGAYYKVGSGHGIAFVDGGNQLLKREFSTQACIVVTDPMPLMGTTLVKIDLPQPGLNNIPAYTDGHRLQYAPECTKQVTAPPPATANDLKGLTLLSKEAFLREEPGHSPIVTQILAGQCVLITDARRSEGWIKVKANTAKGTFEGWGYDIRMDYHKPCNP